jgi:hypothetical protein
MNVQVRTCDGLLAPYRLHACGLSVTDHALPVVVTVTLVGRRKIHRDRPQAQARVPKILEVRSGASWDEVRVRLVPGQKLEDFDEVARALACVRGVPRCQVHELTPNVVSIDFQRRNLLADVPCPELATMAAVEGGGGFAAGLFRTHRMLVASVWTGVAALREPLLLIRRAPGL